MYQALPMFLYLNASFGNTLLSPLLATQEFSTTLDAAASDLGIPISYTVRPDDQCNHVGNQYPMTSQDNTLQTGFSIEGSTHVHSRSLANEGLAETGNMLIMTLASARASGDGSLVSQYARLVQLLHMHRC